MSEQKKNPLIAGLLTLVPSIISTVTGIVKDKREAKAAKVETATIGEAFQESVKEITSGSISSKRLLNIVGTGVIITFALSSMANGITKYNVIVLALGVAYSLGMSIVTWLSERK